MPAVPELRRAEADLLAQVSAEKLMEYTGRIAADVRLSGSPEELEAAARCVEEALQG